MKRKTTPQDIRNKKRRQLAERTQQVFGLQNLDDAIKLLRIERRQSLRINPLKGDIGAIKDELMLLVSDAQQSLLYEHGYSVKDGIEHVRDSPLQQDGYVYIQNAASWLPVLQLNPQAREHILDMCAAPGGKTSLIAALSQNTAQIVANDNSKPRLMRLRANMERLNARAHSYTLFDASRLSRVLDEHFDKILLDAPCSGEGMMRYDTDKDFDNWSVAQIKRLGKLQRRLIMQAWQLLKPGGSLVYSTCTTAPEENEAVVDYLLRRVDDAKIVQHAYPEGAGLNRAAPVLSWGERSYDSRINNALRLAPSESAEAFFVCHLQKTSTSD